ncbi:MAG TPA: TIGR02281 family clan AA aspartic protease [Gammaproteobacteria bacterium]|nr:TIGR02281 family clan AA aspartic protease [Gammaproteobacteria bacterium]
MNDQNRDDSDDTRRMGAGMYYAMWILGLGLLTLLFSNILDRQYNPNPRVESQLSADGTQEVVLQRNRYGHYVATGAINGQEVTFLLDTGATDVSVPLVLADRLGLKKGPVVFFETANGTASGYRTRIDHIRLGNIELHDIVASINPNVQGDEVLLGMSFLKHLEFTQRGNTLTVRQPR